MDFGLDTRQENLLMELERTVDSLGGANRTPELAAGRAYDAELDAALARDIPLGNISLLEGILIADRLAELGAKTTFGAQAVLFGDQTIQPGGLGLSDAGRSDLVRYGTSVRWLLRFTGETAELIDLTEVTLEQVDGGLGFPLGRLPASLPSGIAIPIRGGHSSISLLLAAEIAGASSDGLARTANHLKERKQFGKTLSTFQALRHRVAEHAVTASATRWLVREAADQQDRAKAMLTALYAADGAAALSPELVQLWGARGFAHEFGIASVAMRIQGLRVEIGAGDRLALAYLDWTPEIA